MLVLFLAFGSGLIGFLDDFIKVIKHRNLGLTEAQKMILQIALTVGFMFGLNSLGFLSTQVQFPIFGLVDMGIVYYPVAFLGIIFLVNAVNLTDGLGWPMHRCDLCVDDWLPAGGQPAGLCARFAHRRCHGGCLCGLPCLELLPGEGLYGRHRQHVFRRPWSRRWLL